jgi:hypothetical protein
MWKRWKGNCLIRPRNERNEDLQDFRTRDPRDHPRVPRLLRVQGQLQSHRSLFPERWGQCNSLDRARRIAQSLLRRQHSWALSRPDWRSATRPLKDGVSFSSWTERRTPSLSLKKPAWMRLKLEFGLEE